MSYVFENMSAQPKKRLSSEEYLAIERQAENKSEFYGGEMFAMAGGSPEHNLIAANIIIELGTQLKSHPCRVFTSDQRVKVESCGLYTYPDVVVACGTLRFDDEQKDTILNPTVIVEVLSSSTEGYDRGQKFQMYRHLESLKEYLLVSQDRFHIDHYVREPDGRWLLVDVDGQEGRLQLKSIQCCLNLREVYDKVDFVRNSAIG